MGNLKNVNMIRTLVSGLKMKLLLNIFIFLTIIQAHGQEEFLPFNIEDSIYRKIKTANIFFTEGKYKESTLEFEKSGDILNIFPMERYKYAIALWMINDTVKAKTNFYFALKNGLKFPSKSYFNQSPLIKELSLNQEVYNKAFYTTSLDSSAIFKNERLKLIELKLEDQKYRVGNSVNDSIFKRQDSLNRIPLKQLICLIGWPGFNEVGYDGENSAFLIAQHSDNDTNFQKHCLDLMYSEFKSNNITISNYAMLIDRYLINTNRKQLFGTQVYYNSEIKKTIQKDCFYPDEIDYLRKLFQLNKLEDYLKNFN